jgi:hypothetical protein
LKNKKLLKEKNWNYKDIANYGISITGIVIGVANLIFSFNSSMRSEGLAKEGLRMQREAAIFAKESFDHQNKMNEIGLKFAQEGIEVNKESIKLTLMNTIQVVKAQMEGNVQALKTQRNTERSLQLQKEANQTSSIALLRSR